MSLLTIILNREPQHAKTAIFILLLIRQKIQECYYDELVSKRSTLFHGILLLSQHINLKSAVIIWRVGTLLEVNLMNCDK